LVTGRKIEFREMERRMERQGLQAKLQIGEGNEWQKVIEYIL
jgi:hypothetical protein